MTNIAKVKRELPSIDPRIQYVGASKLRQLNTQELRRLAKILVVQDANDRLAVIMPYKWFMGMQELVMVIGEGSNGPE